MDFESTGLNPQLLKAVKKLGFEAPMPVQAAVLPILLTEATDIVGLAQTGTGKTGAFGLPLLQLIDPMKRHTQGVILCPTRELCLQITNDLKDFGQYIDGLNVVAVYGGAAITTQISQIRRGAQVIVATPGRLLDLMRRNVVKLQQVSYAVLDEADEMLNMGFQEDIDSILSTLPNERNVWLFSATMPRGVARIAKTYLKDPREVTVGTANESAANITHSYYMVHEKHRYQALKRIMDFHPRMYGLIFCRTRKETQQVAENLLQDGYVAESLHGDLSQGQRDAVMRKFRSQTVRILVATDVAARGLDVNDITHVIHYKLPDDAAIYTHRSGRTARAGKSGASIALLNMNEARKMRDLERSGISFEAKQIPSGRDICEKQLFFLVEKIVKTEINSTEIEGYLPKVYESLGGFDKDELIQRFVSAEFSRFLDYYRHSADINVTAKGRQGSEKRFDRERGSSDRDRRGRDGDRGRDRGEKGAVRSAGGSPRPRMDNAHRFFINMGKMDNIGAGAIVRLVCEKASISSDMIGGIKLNREFSFFEVDKDIAEHVKASLRNASLDGRRVEVSDV
ncbi:MAG: ATP-dependent RNA helicase DeaD, partial [Verrucomicrobiales bacterium]